MKLLPLILLLGGCNAVAQISGNTNEIREEAQALIHHGNDVGDSYVVSAATRIDGLAAGIHDQLPNVEARVPEWLSTIQWAMIAVVGITVVVLLFQTGIGSAIRNLLGWIPKNVQNDATLAASVLDDSRPESAREYFAARRADPIYDAAFKKARAALKKEST